VRVHLIGIGTAHADDAAGLAVAALLASRPLPDGVFVSTCARPLPDLLDALDGADAAVLIDAARTGGAPGALRRLAPGDLARLRSPSSHGLGVAQALALASALGRAPAHVELLAIEAGPLRGEALSPAVAASIADAADAALRIARALQDGGEVAIAEPAH
jgi:hydrogenase maturation protease